MNLEAFILTTETRMERDESWIALYCASSHGPLEVLVPYAPYFFFDCTRTLPASLQSNSQTQAWRALSGEDVSILKFRSIPECEAAKHLLRQQGIKVFESDVRPRERFLMDSFINGGIKVEGEAHDRRGILRFKNPILTPARVQVPFRVCSLDIETSISNGSVLSIAAHIVGREMEEKIVFMHGGAADDATIGLKFFPGEREMVDAFLAWFQRVDPDLLIGWNIIGFDLSFLLKRAESLELPLRMGRDRRTISIRENTGRFAGAYVPGRVVLDGPQLLRTSFYTFESYSLESVSQAVLGEGKLIHTPGLEKAKEIERLFREDPHALAAYNLNDAVLVSRIFEKLGLIELTARRSEFSGMLLDQVGMSVASFDHFYLPRMHREGYVAPDVGDTGDASSAPGGYVMSPAAGIYENIIGLDFQSLYPSIIRTFNIDPLARARSGEDPILTPAGHSFSREKSVLPDFIGELIETRRRAKAENNKALSQAIKILMNSFYGVMGSSGSRLYHPVLPDAITSTGQWVLTQSRDWLEEQGHRVIYGDTDSLFVQHASGKKEAGGNFEELGNNLSEELTNWWKNRLKKEFRLESALFLEFKRHYLKFLVPALRNAESGAKNGAKKRYAGLIADGEVEFTGLEVVRSDWTKLAREFQVQLYTKIFKEEEIDDWVREFVAAVRKGAYDDKLVYRKRLHKRPAEYGGSLPPYVRAARMLNKTGREIRYVMTLKGPVPVELQPRDPDYGHYIDKQLRPVADSILEVMGRSFDEVLSAQMKLF